MLGAEARGIGVELLRASASPSSIRSNTLSEAPAIAGVSVLENR